jgi:hypothetical protein
MIIGTTPFNISINFYYLKTLKVKKSQDFNQLKNIDQILKTPQKFIEKEKHMPNNDEDNDYDNINVAVVNKKAYWVKNNTIYTALINEEGDVDISNAKKIDVFSLDQNEVNNLLKIIDKIN